MRQRYYNPEIKRFINQDILTGSMDNSQSLNRYSYVQGNPVSYVDPFGLSPILEQEAGQEKYIVEYHPNHGGEEHFSGNHYHVKRETVNPANNKKIKYRLDNRDSLTPCHSDVYEYPKTFSPGDLLPTINKSGGKK